MPSKSSVLGLPYINLASTWITHIFQLTNTMALQTLIFFKTEPPLVTYYHWHEAPSLVDCVNPNLKTDDTVYLRTLYSKYSETNKMICSGQLVVNSSSTHSKQGSVEKSPHRNQAANLSTTLPTETLRPSMEHMSPRANSWHFVVIFKSTLIHRHSEKVGWKKNQDFRSFKT